MFFLNGLIYLMLLVGIAAGNKVCKKPAASCKSASNEYGASSNCSRYFRTKSIKLYTCTQTITKATPTTTKYIKKGKSTCTHWKSLTSTKTVHTTRGTVTRSTVSTVQVQKTIQHTDTKSSTILTIVTLLSTSTETLTTVKTIFGSPAERIQILKRAIIPKSCSCFATKTKYTTKTPARKTKTVTIPTSTLTLSKTKKFTRTKIVPTAKATKWSTRTTKSTKTHTSTIATVVMVSSKVFVSSVVTTTLTTTLTTFIPEETVTLTKTGTSAYYTTISPSQGASILTVIRYVAQDTITVTRLGASDYVTTVFPTDSTGSTVTDGSDTITVIDYNVFTTITTIANSAYTSTVYPKGANGVPITDGSLGGTVLIGVVQTYTTLTRPAPGRNEYFTTLSGDGFIVETVIKYIPRSTLTLHTLAIAPFTSTVYPTGAVASTDQSIPVTIIIGENELTTTVVTSYASTTGLKTVFPTDGSNIVSIITFITRALNPTTTLTSVASSAYTTTLFPLDNYGHTTTGMVSVIDFITWPVTTVTLVGTSQETTIFPLPTDVLGTISVVTYTIQPTFTLYEPATGISPSVTTIFPAPTDVMGTVTVIDYVVQAITSLTLIGSSAYITALYPTDQAGSTITGASGTLTVVQYETNPATTIISPATNLVDSSTTIKPQPTIPPGTITIIYYLIRPVTTVNQVATGTTNYQSTIYPSNTQNPTSPPVTILNFTTSSRTFVTVTRVANGNSPSATTVYPTDPLSPATVISYVPRRTTTVVNGGNTPYTTTIIPGSAVDVSIPISVIIYDPGHTMIRLKLPATGSVGYTTALNPNNPNDPITIIQYVERPTATLTEVGASVYTTTVYPRNTLDVAATVSVIDFVTQRVTTITKLASSAHSTTITPNPSDVSGVITVIDYVAQPTTTLTRAGASAHTTTLFPIDGNGATITAATAVVTEIVYVLLPTVTQTQTDSITHIATNFPTDSTDVGGTVTVITYTVLQTITETQTDSIAHISTILPSGVSSVGGTVTVITYTVLPTITQTRTDSITHISTQYPSNIAGTVTIVTYTVLPTVTQTKTDSTSHLSTILPPSAGGTVTIITYTVLPTVIETQTDSTTHASTIIPSNTMGIGGTVTVITYIVLPTTTATRADSSTHATTIYPPNPTAPDVTVTVITYRVQSVTTLSSIDTISAHTMTLYPTDSAGLSISDGSGTATVIIFYTPSPTPDLSCGNAGLQVAVYDNPLVTGKYQPVEYFGTQIPYGINETQVLGFSYPLNANKVPYGFPTHTIYSEGAIFALNYRGYFYSNQTQNYTISASNTDDFLALWVGEKAASKWSKSNADIFLLGPTLSSNISISIGAGEYVPLRLVYGNLAGIASYSLSIVGDDGIPYVTTQTTSLYLVQYSCDGVAETYPPYGEEFPIPSCNNTGLQVGVYRNPFQTPTNIQFDPAAFQSLLPTKSNATNILGLTSASSLPAGLTYSSANYFALNYKGYFYAPFSGTYTFNLSQVDDVLYVWTGTKAYANWTQLDPDVWNIFISSNHLPVPLFQISLTGGTYLPLRILYGQSEEYGSYNLDIYDQDGFYYVESGLPSQFLVQTSCGSSIFEFPQWGAENDTSAYPAESNPPPSTYCDNLGFDISIYDNVREFDYTHNNYPGFNFSDVPTLQPYGESVAPYLGWSYAQTTAANTSTGYGMFGLASHNFTNFILNYRGFFQCPKSQSYTVTLSNGDDVAGAYIGPIAQEGWGEDNKNLTNLFNSGPTTQSTTLTCVAGDYIPIRVVWSNVAGPRAWDLKILGSDGTVYVASQTPSNFLFRYPSCDVSNSF
ncbi:hypothetical protein TWF694_009385 [Orbilia ellipsospora]|uniref:PA14 domain-containing protein n=1 Tax=Orbilia ellipsospora TaxID=2528407 RepID=A0AAV9XBV8_9PEZI